MVVKVASARIGEFQHVVSAVQPSGACDCGSLGHKVVYTWNAGQFAGSGHRELVPVPAHLARRGGSFQLTNLSYGRSRLFTLTVPTSDSTRYLQLAQVSHNSFTSTLFHQKIALIFDDNPQFQSSTWLRRNQRSAALATRQSNALVSPCLSKMLHRHRHTEALSRRGLELHCSRRRL